MTLGCWVPRPNPSRRGIAPTKTRLITRYIYHVSCDCDSVHVPLILEVFAVPPTPGFEYMDGL